MSKPFKFRYVNELVGIFMLLVLAALLAGVLLAGRAQGWFEKKHYLHIQLPIEGSAGLNRGAEVQVLETVVGAVERIDVSEEGLMEARLMIRGDFIRFVRSDSRAIIKRKFAVAGDAYIEITVGRGAELADGAFLPSERDTEIIEMATQLVEQLEGALLPILEDVATIVRETAGLLTELRAPEGPVQSLLARLDRISAEIEKGQGVAGRLVADDATAEELDEMLRRINDILAETQAIVRDVGAVTGQLPAATAQTRELMNETTTLLDGLQRHWLLRRYMTPAADERDDPLPQPPLPVGAP